MAAREAKAGTSQHEVARVGGSEDESSVAARTIVLGSAEHVKRDRTGPGILELRRYR
jgi:hypothetical protein